MNSTRRALLKTLGVIGVTLPFTACERLISSVTQQSIPDRLNLAEGSEIDPSFHLLSRAAYGPWPGDFDRVRVMGSEAWIEEQLSPESIDDTSCDLRARRFETIWHEPGTCYEYKKPVLREEITRHTLLRALYSKRQLFEVMVGFWTDHLNINFEKGDCIYLKPADDRLVIRAHALGTFKELIRALAPETAPASTGERTLVCVFLRGAADTLNMVVPYGDDEYYRLRPTIGIPEESSSQTDSLNPVGPSGLKVLIDYRSVLAEVLTKFLGHRDMDQVFPKFHPEPVELVH